MNDDPANINLLHDIVMPPSTPWWPLAPGWLWLLALVSIVALVLLVRWFIRWQQNRYRREALAELSRLEQTSDSSGALVELSALLKRTALTACKREQVASLTGAEWFAFLDRTGGTRFGDGLGEVLEAAKYNPSVSDWPSLKTAELINEIRQWIRHHDPALVINTPQTAGSV